MTESRLWNWLSEARFDLGPDSLQIGRLENSIESGWPDTEGFARINDREHFTHTVCRQFWIELKHVARPARPTTKLRFDFRNRAKQIEWLRRRWQLGGAAFYLLAVGSGHDRRLYLAQGDYGHLLAQPILETELAALSHPLPAKCKPADVIRGLIKWRSNPSNIRPFQSKHSSRFTTS